MPRLSRKLFSAPVRPVGLGGGAGRRVPLPVAGRVGGAGRPACGRPPGGGVRGGARAGRAPVLVGRGAPPAGRAPLGVPGRGAPLGAGALRRGEGFGTLPVVGVRPFDEDAGGRLREGSAIYVCVPLWY